jgi:hypothetical protein
LLGYDFLVGPEGYLRGNFYDRRWESSSARRYRGVQLDGNYRLFNLLTLGGNYTWARTKGDRDDLAVQASARHRLNAWLEAALPFGGGRFDLGLLQRYPSALSLFDPGVVTGGGDGSAEGGNEELDSIFSTDFSVIYSHPLHDLEPFLKADVTNLFNRQGVEFAPEAIASMPAASTPDSFQTPRSYRFVIGLHF